MTFADAQLCQVLSIGSQDLLDQIIESRVERAEIGGGDGDEDDCDRGGLDQGVAIGPLDLFQLGPAGEEKADDAAALALLRLRLFLLLGELLSLAALLLAALALFAFLQRLGFGAFFSAGGL